MIELSRSEARRLILEQQGLYRKHPFGKGREASLRAIEELSYVQIDTIAVVERAHHHTLWTRVPSYRAEHLDELLSASRQIFEYWSHAAAYLPIRDYRFSLPRKRYLAAARANWKSSQRRLLKAVMDRIRSEGPLSAGDFNAPAGHKSGGWWEWKPAKQALEHLFMDGSLMVSSRRNFHKYYDLTERVLPEDTDTSFPGQRELAEHLIRRFLCAQGLGSSRDFSYQRRGMQKDVASALATMIETGEVSEISVPKLGGEALYALSVLLEKIPRRKQARQILFLSPFDNLLIQRQRAQYFFNFSYTLECYVPRAKRQFGYFCLPILWGEDLIGRLDAKAERKEKLLRVHTLLLEEGREVTDRLIQALAEALRRFAAFNGCDSLVLDHCSPGNLRGRLQRQLS